jgi:NADH:ubiquinone oxidoreductase subunit 6 (subunit J)
MRSFVFYFVWSIIISIIVTMTFSVSEEKKLSNNIDKKSIFANTSFGIIFITLFVYSIQLTSLTILVGQVFKKSKLKFEFY